MVGRGRRHPTVKGDHATRVTEEERVRDVTDVMPMPGFLIFHVEGAANFTLRFYEVCSRVIDATSRGITNGVEIFGSGRSGANFTAHGASAERTAKEGVTGGRPFFSRGSPLK